MAGAILLVWYVMVIKTENRISKECFLTYFQEKLTVILTDVYLTKKARTNTVTNRISRQEAAMRQSWHFFNQPKQLLSSLYIPTMIDYVRPADLRIG